MATGAIIARIITQYSAKGSKQAQKDITKLGKDFDKFANKTAKAFAVAAAASAAFAIKVGKDAVKGAMEDQKQQVALATALRNVTGATDEAIAKTVEYLDKLELLVGVDNNQLIPSLQILTQATKDVTTAQNLQALALDISAGATKDLGSVSLALAKAVGGNVTALTKLGVPLDADAVKAKDLDAILNSLAATFSGQASQRAETFEFRINRLNLAFNQILDQLGYALIPVLEQLAITIQNEILPQLQAWITANKDELAAGLETIINQVPVLIEQVINLFRFIKRNLGTIKVLSALLVSTFAGAKVYAGVIALTTGINILTAAFGRQAVAATAAGTATAFATGGASALAAVAGIAAFTTAALIAFKTLTKTNKVLDKNNKVLDKTKKKTTEIAKTYKQTTFNTGKILTNTVKLTAEQKKQLATTEALNKLKAMGVVPTSENDPIQLEAVRLNLLKEQNLAQQRMYDQLLANYEATERTRIAAERYADILIAISDNKITTFEVAALAAKWGVTNEEVLKYIGRVLNVPQMDGWDFEGLLAASGWEAALKALNEYLKTLKTLQVRDGIFDPAAFRRGEEKDRPFNANQSFLDEMRNVDESTRIQKFRQLGVPEYGNGGIVTKPTAAIIGEMGAEAVIPLSKMGGMGATVNITVNGSVTSASDLTEFVRNGILAGQTSGRVITSSVVDL